jgi:hypothetical protein
MSRAVLAFVPILAVALPASAHAAGPAAATITFCKVDRMTVAGKVAVTGPTARKVRGAKLQLRFRAMPLFGLPRSVAWRDLGKKTKASGHQDFVALPADNWAGVLSWRFVKGRKTVLSGDERSEPVKVGSKKGKANCTLPEGAKTPDTTPPALFIVPADEAWHRGPAPVQLLAHDAYTGVQSVRYSLDGGPVTEIRNGTSFTIPNEGAHTVQWSATDVAGNTASRAATVKVDGGPPTKPALSRPFSVTTSATPTFRWSASADSGSGVKGYFLAIRRTDGTVVAAQPFDAATTSAPSPAALAEGQTYTATVTAVDNTDTSWTVDSDPLTFRVDSSPEVTATDPADGSVLSFGRKSGNLTVTLDRPADPATVTATTVSLARNSALGTSIPVDPPSCASPCSTITIHPTSALPEGRYTLSVNGVKSEEGAAIAAKTVKFAVPSYENPNVSTTNACGPLPPPRLSTTIQTNGGAETILVGFSYTLNSGTGAVNVYADGSATPAHTNLSPPGGSPTPLSFTLATQASHAIQVEYCIASGSGTLTLSNVYVSRAP